MHGWPQAPYETKVEVDANYKRMLEYGCRPEHARGRAPRHRQPQPLRHRLRPRAARGARRRSRGSSSRCWRAWPTTRRARCRRAPAGCCSTRRWCSAEDFHSAIAYLVRRLDENTAPENFLRHVFDLEPGSPDVGRGARSLPGRLRPAWRRCSDAPRRTQDRGAEARAEAGRRGLSTRLRERARHRLDARRQPRVDRATSWPLARAPAGGHPAPDRRASSRAGARRGGGPRSLAPRRASPIATRWRTARDVEPRARRRPRRAAGVGRPAGRGARGACSRPCAAELAPAARRPDRRDDPRRRQDRDRGRRRGLRGDRLRALLRAHAARGGRRAGRLPAWSRSASWS